MFYNWLCLHGDMKVTHEDKHVLTFMTVCSCFLFLSHINLDVYLTGSAAGCCVARWHSHLKLQP